MVRGSWLLWSEAVGYCAPRQLATLESGVGWTQETEKRTKCRRGSKALGLAMNKLPPLEREKVRSRSVFEIRPQSNGVGGEPGTGDGVTLGSRYHIREEDLHEIHKAAYRGNVPEVQRLLSLCPWKVNDRDKRKR